MKEVEKMNWFETKNKEMSEVVAWLESALDAEREPVPPRIKVIWNYTDEVHTLQREISKAKEHAQYADGQAYYHDMRKVNVLMDDLEKLKRAERENGKAEKVEEIY